MSYKSGSHKISMLTDTDTGTLRADSQTHLRVEQACRQVCPLCPRTNVAAPASSSRSSCSGGYACSGSSAPSSARPAPATDASRFAWRAVSVARTASATRRVVARGEAISSAALGLIMPDGSAGTAAGTAAQGHTRRPTGFTAAQAEGCSCGRVLIKMLL